MSATSPGIPSCYLNHFYVVLDSPAYHAIVNDSFMRQRFAPNELRTTIRTDETYTGLYFYGINTYFEFFDVANSGGRRVGDWGLAFGVDEVGAIDTLRAAAGPTLGQETTPITRLYQGQQVPWFLMASLAHFPLRSSESAWVMEYRPAFLQRWNPLLDGVSGVRRRDILARYKDVLDGQTADPVLADVVGVTVATTRQTRNRLAEFSRRVGYQIERDSRSEVVLRGPDLLLQLVPSGDDKVGIVSMEMMTHENAQRSGEKHYGRAALRFTTSGATFAFR